MLKPRSTAPILRKAMQAKRLKVSLSAVQNTQKQTASPKKSLYLRKDFLGVLGKKRQRLDYFESNKQ